MTRSNQIHAHMRSYNSLKLIKPFIYAMLRVLLLKGITALYGSNALLTENLVGADKSADMFHLFASSIIFRSENLRVNVIFIILIHFDI